MLNVLAIAIFGFMLAGVSSADAANWKKFDSGVKKFSGKYGTVSFKYISYKKRA